MFKPIIGITTGIRADGTDRRIGCPVEYIDAVLQAGGVPVLLPPVDDPDAIAAAVRAIDGLLLSGGGDVAPDTCGERPHPAARGQDPLRDRAEIAAIRAAMQGWIPILGICRGIQILNVALGGTVMQDVPSMVPGAVTHDSGDDKAALAHTVEIEQDSLLARVFGTASTGVTSRHHQAVRTLGEGLRVNCRAPDGVIEGIEAADGRRILAVQCHPESRFKDHLPFRRLFAWLTTDAQWGRPF